MRMVVGVRPPPVLVGDQGEHSDAETDPISRTSPSKIGSVPAVVLDHEKADHKARGWNSKQEGEHVAHFQAPEHRDPQGREEAYRRRELHDASTSVPSTIGSNDPPPVLGPAGFVGATVGHRQAISS